MLPAEPPDVSQSESSDSPAAPEAANRRILVIEDDRDIVETVEHILRLAGHDVKSTTNGKDALRLVELLNPDLIITDVIMPEVDTLDVIVQLRHRYPALKIIAISGNPHLLTLAAKHGANHVLAKPFNLHQLTLLVKVALR
jgi:two-component system cell cycle sensor histidine kinase/response regulator CckA